MNNERINKLIDTPFDSINPVNYDEVITELQGRLRKAEKVVEAAEQYTNYVVPANGYELDGYNDTVQAIKEYKANQGNSDGK